MNDTDATIQPIGRIRVTAVYSELRNAIRFA
jgi:hypothetical protein